MGDQMVGAAHRAAGSRAWGYPGIVGGHSGVRFDLTHAHNEHQGIAHQGTSRNGNSTPDMGSGGASRRRRLLPYRPGVCLPDQRRAVVATRGVGGQRRRVRHTHRIRALSTAQPNRNGCAARCRRCCDRGIPSCRSRHDSLAVDRIEDSTHVASRACSLASRDGCSGVCWRAGGGSSAGACSTP